MTRQIASTLDTGQPPPGVRYTLLDAARRRAGIAALLSEPGGPDHEAADRFLTFAQSNHIALDNLWGAIDASDRIIASALAVPNPGKTVMFFATAASTSAEVGLIGGLIDRVASAAGDQGHHLAQTLLPHNERQNQKAFAAGGFNELASLSYLDRPLPGRPLSKPEWPAGVSLETYTSENRHAFIEALDASYENTRDCPGLGGLRDTPDILDGHAGTGSLDPELWTLLRLDEKPAGVLLLNPIPNQHRIELVYLGLARFARGRGLGRRLLHHGLRTLKTQHGAAISLAVDEANEPALRLYREVGFRRGLRRMAMIRSLRNDR